MPGLKEETRAALISLVGLPLCLTKNSGNLRGFHFGAVLRSDKGGLMGQYTLHIGCPWRIEGADKVVTGSGDYYDRADDNQDPEWDPNTGYGSYQEQALRKLFGGVDQETDTCLNVTGLLVVEEVTSDRAGGAALSLSGGYRLVIFPSGARGESWRLLPPGEGHHFVVEDGEAHTLGEDAV